MQIKYKRTDDLIPYINNPRFNDEAVEYVANSIKEFGFKVPIIIDKHNEIIAGHTRLKASQKLGMSEVPVIVADDLTDEQVRAFRLADNKTSDISSWDMEILIAELNALEESVEIDMESFGFETIITDVDLTNAYEDIEPRKQTESHNKLIWGNHSIEISEEDIEILDNLYFQYQNYKDCGSFVRWIEKQCG